MKKLLYVIALVVVGSICACTSTNIPTSELLDENWDSFKSVLFPTNFHISEKKYSFPSEARSLARKQWKQTDTEILYEMIIDRKGRVVKIRTIACEIEDDVNMVFVSQMKQQKFNPSTHEKQYRTFYFPLNVKSEVNIID